MSILASFALATTGCRISVNNNGNGQQGNQDAGSNSANGGAGSGQQGASGTATPSNSGASSGGGGSGGGTANNPDNGGNYTGGPNDSGEYRIRPPSATGGPGAGQFPYYSSYRIDQTTSNLNLSAAVVVIHGIARDANNAFAIMGGAANKAGQKSLVMNEENTLIVAPHFEANGCTTGTSGANSSARGDLVWGCDTWQYGAAAENDANVTSFDAVDAVIAQITTNYKSIANIVVVGYAAGGEFVQRYAGVGKYPDPHGAGSINVRFVTASPGAYMYLDGRRPTSPELCTWGNAGVQCDPSNQFVEGPASNCPAFDTWKYGLENLTGAAAKVGAPAIADTYLSRDVTYVLADQDTGTGPASDYADLDTSCQAASQGKYRYDRGLSFFAYVKTSGTKDHVTNNHRAALAKDCAHDASCVCQSDAGVVAIFGR